MQNRVKNLVCFKFKQKASLYTKGGVLESLGKKRETFFELYYFFVPE